MHNHSLTKIYEILRQELITRVGSNTQLSHKITVHNLNYLFEFHKRKGLAIDLCRFEKEYYQSVFYPSEEQQNMIAELERKVVLVMRSTLIRIGKEEISLTMILRNRVSEVTHWHTFYIGEAYTGKSLAQWSRKLEDW